MQQVITVPTVGTNAGFTAIQAYSYDSLNRLSSATETESSTQTWKQEFSYDRYGNRNFVTGSGHTTSIASGCDDPVCNPTVSTSTNRLTSSGYSNDNAGNTTADAQSRTFSYDGENKQVQVSNGSGTVGQYWYVGDGKGVKKYVSGTGEETIFVYDAAGKQIAEYSTIVADSSTAMVNYLTTDHLGSPRINTDANGAVISRHDYLPFGEEIDGTGGRTTGLNYVDDTVRKQFTSYERDIETDLDFAQARYYKSQQGRFNSPDPLLGSGIAINPKTWNRYSYVLNNPLKLVDPTGLISIMGLISIDHEDLHSSDGEPSKPPSVTIQRNDQVNFYTVSGKVNDAISTASKHFKGSFAGDVQAGIRVVGPFGKEKQWFRANSTPIKGGNYQITAREGDFVIEATTTTTLPKWDGYDSASADDKKTWDDSMTVLKAHEDGHVEINKQEAENLKTEIESVLPSTSTFTSISKTSAGGISEARRSLNVQKIDSTINDGLSRYHIRNENYERNSEHRLSPQQLKGRGIVF